MLQEVRFYSTLTDCCHHFVSEQDFGRNVQQICQAERSRESLRQDEMKACKGPGKWGHLVADILLPMTLLGLCKLGNICCGHKKKSETFLCPGHKICVRNNCCACGQMGKHLRRQQCVLIYQGLKTSHKQRTCIIASTCPGFSNWKNVAGGNCKVAGALFRHDNGGLAG